MTFLISIAVPAWYFFYLDLSLNALVISGLVCGILWYTNRHAFLHLEGASENPLVQLAMAMGMFGLFFSIITIIRTSIF